MTGHKSYQRRGYLGGGTAFEQAIATFVDSYAEQVTRDYDALTAAVRSGRVAAVRDAGLICAGSPPRRRVPAASNRVRRRLR